MEEKAAIAHWYRYASFCQNGAGEYEQQRFSGSGRHHRLSANRNGRVISPVFARLLAEQPQALDGVWPVVPDELIWREFYRHLMTYYLVVNILSVARTDRVRSGRAIRTFTGPGRRQTGSRYPIVDAMRQLNSTGWMHNRLRMITASFC